MNRGSNLIKYDFSEAALDPSMRPRFMNRGSVVIADPAALLRLPSMRPRFMNRGSWTNPEWVRAWLDPSMRPRFMNRGSDT